MKIISLMLLSVFLCIACGAHENSITIGAVLPLTGSAAQYGEYIQEGIELALEEINAEGINGKQLRIIYEDSQCNPSLAANAMQKLATVDHVPLVLGDWCSSDVLAMAPIAEQTQTVLFASAISPKIRDAGDFVFRIQPDSFYYIDQLVSFIVENYFIVEKDGKEERKKIGRVAILFINNDFGVGLKDYFIRKFEAVGGEIAAVESFEQDASDFRSELLKIKDKNADAIFIPAYAKETGLILKQSRELGINRQFFASATMENEQIIAIAGDAAENVLYPYHFDQDSIDPAVAAFQQRYGKAYGHMAEGFAALMYDGVQLLARILEQCGEESACIRDALYATQYRGVTGKTRFDDHGDVIKPIIMKTVRDGKFIIANGSNNQTRVYPFDY